MKKLLMFCFVFLLSVMSINAAITDGVVVYFSFDDDDTSGATAIDSSENQNGTIISGLTTGVVGKFKQAYKSLGGAEAVTVPYTGTIEYSIGFWAKGTGTNDMISADDEATLRNWAVRPTIGVGFVGANANTPSFSTTINDDVWYYITQVYDTTGLRVYVNGVLDGTDTTYTGNGNTHTTPIVIFKRKTANIMGFNGTIDEVVVYNRVISTAEMSELMLGNPYGNASTVTTNLSSIYNTTNISIQINSTRVINLSYSLDGDSDLTVWTNKNNGTLNLTGLSEGDHNITWIDSVKDNLTQNFTIDLTNPSLNVSSFLEVNTYLFNFSKTINASIDNISSCVVVTDQNTTTCDNEIYSFINSGNHTYNVTLTDTAGNTNSSINNVAFINPFQNFFFINSTGGLVSNYTLGGINYVGNTSAIPTYGSIISLGNNSFLFEKQGFSSLLINFSVNLTSAINLSTNVTQSKIVLNFFDRETLNLITGTTTVTLIGPSGFNSTTTNGMINISDINFISGDYQIIASNPAYETESIYFAYSNQETLEKDVYMLSTGSTDIGTVTVQVTASSGQFVQGAICSALEWRPSSSAFVSVAEGLTNTEGSTLLNIELATKLYKFQCTKEGAGVASPQQIIQQNGTLIPLVLTVGQVPPTLLFGNLFYSLTNTSYNLTHQRVIFNFTSSDNLVTEACLNQYRIAGNLRIILNSTCASSSTGQIQLIVNINETFTQVVEASATEGGVTKAIDSITFPGSFSLESSLNEYGFAVWLPLLVVLLGLALGFMIVPSNTIISTTVTLIGLWLLRYTLPNLMSYSSTIFMSVVIGLIIWGSKK